jgi:hypothetical protein
VAIFIITVSISYAVLASVEQHKTQKWATLLENKDEFVEDIYSELSLYSQCNKILMQSIYGKGTKEGNLDDVFDSNGAQNKLDLDFLNSQFETPDLVIKDARLSYFPDPNSDPQKGSKYNSYRGTLTLNLDLKNPPPGPYMQLRPVAIRLSIFDPVGEHKWSNVSCATYQSSSTSSVAKNCALYGGTLIDAVHCDFSRYFRKPQGGAMGPVTKNSIATMPPADVKNNNQRFSLSDVMCYVDTLTAMIPDNNFSNPGPANPNYDFYRRDYNTRFCKKPGRVLAAASVNGPQVMQYISEDVKDMFTDVNKYKSKCVYIEYNYAINDFECLGTCSNPALNPDGTPFYYNNSQYCYDSYYDFLANLGPFYP